MCLLWLTLPLMADDKDLCVIVTFPTPANSQSPVKTLRAAAQSHSTTLISPYHMGPQCSWEGSRWIPEDAHALGRHWRGCIITCPDWHSHNCVIAPLSINARAPPSGRSQTTYIYLLCKTFKHISPHSTILSPKYTIVIIVKHWIIYPAFAFGFVENYNNIYMANSCYASYVLYIILLLLMTHSAWLICRLLDLIYRAVFYAVVLKN